MTKSNTEVAKATRTTRDQLSPGSSKAAYRKPQMFVLGTSAELIRGSQTGHLRDSYPGWWVYGS